ncbi:MAG TPA: NADH-quinone oxidoreductase subunit M, partial [Flavisolibacter sp.]
FNGIWNSGVTSYRMIFAAVAGLSIILAAAYTLRMIQKIFFGNTNNLTAMAHDIRVNERVALSVIVGLIVLFGIYPQPLLNITNGFVENLLREINVAPMFSK